MRSVLVTGASGGIGSAIAKAFLSEGDLVWLGCHHRAAETQALCQAYRAKGLNARALPFDASDPSACQNAVETAGRVDVLVNNAGLSFFSLLQDMTDDQWRTLFALNVDAAFYLSRAVLPQMIERQSGVILNISSMWGQVGASMEVAYSATKAALIGFTKALAKEVGPSGIRVNALAPGLIHTDMNAALSKDALAALIEETPLGREGLPADVAAACLFLSSDAASFITGQTLPVNGGFVI